MADPIPAQKEPYKVSVEAGKKYFWCACGRSKKQPFCDGSHMGTPFTPRVIVVDDRSDDDTAAVIAGLDVASIGNGDVGVGEVLKVRLASKQAAAEQAAAEQRGEAGWLLTLDYPSFHPVMTYAEDAGLREEMYRAYQTRASD